jgi:hypothetical protein
MLYAYKHPDQETPYENSIIFTPNFNFAKKIDVPHNSTLLTPVTTTHNDCADSSTIERQPRNREGRGSNEHYFICHFVFSFND